MSKLNWRWFSEQNNLLFLAALLITAYFVWNTFKVIQNNYELQQQVDKLEGEIAVLELENSNLKLSNEYYKTDSYLEVEAREKFNKVAAGEKLLILPKYTPAAESAPDATETESTKPEHEQNLDQWLYFLFGKEPS